jgi:hypothetical protein
MGGVNMRYRINNTYENRGYSKGIVYRKFKNVFEQIFHETLSGIPNISPEDLYVEADPVMKEDLCSFLRPGDHIAAFLGYTGMGKTSAIRHYLCSSSIPTIDNSYLILPFCYSKNDLESEHQVNIYIAKVLLSGIIRLLKETQELFTDLERDFYNNKIEKGDMLFVDPLNPNFDEASYRDAIEAAKKENLVVYYTYLLEYVIDKMSLSHGIKGVLFIVDDIELLESNIEIHSLKQHMRIYKILTDTDHQKAREYYIKTLIAMRPHVYRYSLDASYKRQLLGFDWPSVDLIKLTTPPSIKSVVERRINLLLEKEEIDLKDDAVKVVKQIIDVIDQQLQKTDIWKSTDDFMLAICHNNVRSSLQAYSRILSCNKLQKQEFVQGSFGKEITIDDYYITPPTIIRALAYGDKNIYKYEPYHDSTGEKSHIPNILYNTRESGSDLLGLLVVAYLYNKQIPMPESDSSYHLYIGTASRDEVCDELGNLLPEYFKKANIDDCIEYYLKGRILMKSITEAESTIENNHPSGAKELYLSPRGVTLYKLLNEFSILLEIYRDDIWMDKNFFYSVETNKLSQREKFRECIRIIDILFQEESSIVYRIHNSETSKLKEYIDYFGEDMQTLRLVRGLSKSFSKVLDRNEYKDIADDLTKLQGKVEGCQRQVLTYLNECS